MIYSKELARITQNQAIENLKAMLASEYFKEYNFDNARLSSDLVTADLKRGYSLQNVRLKIADITNTFTSLLEVASSKGTLTEVFVELKPSDEMMRSMQFEKKLYEEDLALPLNISIRKEGTTENSNYRFSIVNLGLKQSYFESQGLNFKDAQTKVSKWYRELTKNLKKMLPYEFSK